MYLAPVYSIDVFFPETLHSFSSLLINIHLIQGEGRIL